MGRHHATAGLFVFACTAAAFWPPLLHAQDTEEGMIKELAGSWTLASVTTHVGAMSVHPMPPETVKDIQPYGSNPKGRLIFERNGRFASTVMNSDGSKPPASNDTDSPAEFEA